MKYFKKIKEKRMLKKEIADLIAMGLAIENTPKHLTIEDGDQPEYSVDSLTEYGIEVPEEIL